MRGTEDGADDALNEAVDIAVDEERESEVLSFAPKDTAVDGQ